MPRDRLSLKQSAFAELYVSLHGNGTEAARQSGYGGSPERRAYENLRNPLVQAEIERIRHKQQDAVTLTLEWWRREILSVYRKADAAGDRPNALRALELVGKHLGLFDTRADTASAELSARLTQHLVQAMALQMATATAETPVTVEGQFRAMIGVGAAP